ncbi:MAG: PilZ domain-containing protein [Terriglobia bacterium]
MEEQPVSPKPSYPTGADRRTAKRASLVTQIRTSSGGQTLVGYSRDISIGGVFVETEDPPEKGSELALRFRLAPDSPIREARATVVYRLPGEGMGLRFLDLPDELRQAIEQFVTQQE